MVNRSEIEMPHIVDVNSHKVYGNTSDTRIKILGDKAELTTAVGVQEFNVSDVGISPGDIGGASFAAAKPRKRLIDRILEGIGKRW